MTKDRVSLHRKRNILYFADLMLPSYSYKSKQFLWLVFKLVILILLGTFIYRSLVFQEGLTWEAFYSVLLESTLFSPTTLLILLLFTVLNWLLEITKWKILSTKIQSTPWQNATEQSLASLSFSLITPNRIGEYGAKALYYPKESRSAVLILNFIGNFYQLIITLVIGTIGIMNLKDKLQNEVPEIVYTFLQWVPLLFLLTIALFQFSKGLQKWRLHFQEHFVFITKKLNFQVLSLSFVRYVIFSHQFYFLLLIFNANISYWIAMMAISSMYLIASIIPMLSLFDFVVKGSVAVLIFSLFGVSTLIILTITTLMWILNFVLPAIVGSYYVVKFKPIAS